MFDFAIRCSGVVKANPSSLLVSRAAGRLHYHYSRIDKRRNKSEISLHYNTPTQSFPDAGLLHSATSIAKMRRNWIIRGAPRPSRGLRVEMRESWSVAVIIVTIVVTITHHHHCCQSAWAWRARRRLFAQVSSHRPLVSFNPCLGFDKLRKPMSLARSGRAGLPAGASPGSYNVSAPGPDNYHHHGHDLRRDISGLLQTIVVAYIMSRHQRYTL